MPTNAVALLQRAILALCIWREARGESFRGKCLVGQTIRNRVLDPRWPDTYGGVITQRWQFSAFNPNDPNALKFPAEFDPAWLDSVEAADAVLRGEVQSSCNHYHTAAVNPVWKDDSKVVAREGHHIFYTL